MKDGVFLKKLLVFLFSLIFICGITVNVFAAKAECELDLPDDFTVSAASDELGELARIFGIKASTLEQYYKDNNVLYLAANEDNSCQVTLCAVKNEFSEGAVSFSRLSDTELNAVAEEFAGDSFENEGIVKGKDGNRYIKLKKNMSDSGGKYTVTEYITVCSYKLFTLSVSVSDGADSGGIETVALKGLEITDLARADDGQRNFIFIILAAVGIAVFATVAVYFTVSVIRDIKKNKMSRR